LALKRSDLGVGVLIAANLAFLVWVGHIWVESFAVGTLSAEVGSGPDTPEGVSGRKAVTQRALSVHLPLAGTVGADAVEGDGCERLKGFLLDASFHLDKVDAQAPLDPREIDALVMKKRCSLSEPEVAAAMERFRITWLEAALPEVGPLSAQ